MADEVSWNPAFARRTARLAGSEIRELLKLLGRSNIISFAGGIPDPELFPHEAIRAVTDAILDDADQRQVALQYSVSEGYAPLRDWLATDMRRLGVRCDPENVIVVNGSQQGIDFAARLFLDPGSCVLVQTPTFLGALQTFDSYEAVYRPFAPEAVMDEAGVAARLAYVMTDFHNPTGHTMTLDERQDMVRLLAGHQIPVLEDNAYERLRYDGEPQPSLMAVGLDGKHVDTGHFLYTGTFSKSMSPGLRIGFMVAPRHLIDKLVMIKQGSDLQAATLNQMIAFKVASEAAFAERLELMRSVYIVRRDAMLVALDRHFPSTAQWTRPEGGMFVWVTLPAGIDAHRLLERAVETIGVAFVPGRAFFADRMTGANTMRLSFSRAAPEQIERGISALGSLIRQVEEQGVLATR